MGNKWTEALSQLRGLPRILTGVQVFEPGYGAVAAARRSIARVDLNSLFLIRLGTVTVQTAAVGSSMVSPGSLVPVAVLGLTNVVFVVASLLILEQIRRKTTLDDDAFFKQIVIDIAVLTYLLALSGGPANPFHDMYVLPMTIAAATLPAAYVWRTAAFLMICYGILEFVHRRLPDTPEVADLIRGAEMCDHVLLALLLSYFVTRMSHGLRERDRQLAEAHEREIRAGCAITLGSVAAGAAHELSTPLSTISTVVEELHEDHDRRPELAQSLALLQASLRACLLCLKDLRSYSDAWMKGGEVVPADRFLIEVTKRFRALRPGIHVRQVFASPLPGPLMVPDLALQQGIVNLLNNAAFMSPLDVTLTAFWNDTHVVIQVADKGDGISPELAKRVGHDFVTTKPPAAGNGIGLFLTNVTVSRLGGSLRLFNAPEGGAVAEIKVPLASLSKGRCSNEQFA